VTADNLRGRQAQRTELAAFLRAARARLTPADVGLPAGSASGRRRVPGLRREEVAELSGVGVTWYTWLEQGRGISASAQVIDALARALLLTGDQHGHLRELAGLPQREPQPPDGDLLLPRLQRLVDAMAPNLVAVHDRYFDYVVWNEPLARVREDPGMLPPGRRNIIWMMFTDPANRARMVHWEPGARSLLARFRAAAGRHPDDPRFAELVAALSQASPQFREWWADYPVRSFRPVTIEITHPQAGLIAVEMSQLRLVDQPDLIMVIQVPADNSSLTRIRSLLTGSSQHLPHR
jgi:transcriptional regulator with XRE-family HTH domain